MDTLQYLSYMSEKCEVDKREDKFQDQLRKAKRGREECKRREIVPSFFYHLNVSSSLLTISSNTLSIHSSE